MQIRILTQCYFDDPSSNPTEAYSFFCQLFQKNENLQ